MVVWRDNATWVGWAAGGRGGGMGLSAQCRFIFFVSSLLEDSGYPDVFVTQGA